MNSERREINKEGKMFIPMNMTGNTDNENFINVFKLLVVGLIVFVTVLIYGKLNSIGASIVTYIIVTLVYILIVQYIVRTCIFEEKYFFKTWKKTKSYKNPTPGVFWNISSISHTKFGDIVIFSDMKIGCYIKLERDTIVGKVSDYVERHFDAWSEFYKEANLRGLGIVQCNIMEPAGKDSRIDDLALLASHCNNFAVRELLEQEVGYIKEISRATLSECDCILLYDKSVTHLDTLIGDINDCISKLLDGAYAEAKILKEKEIYKLPKDIFNVEYFDGITAQINVYKNANYKVRPVMIIDSIGFDDKSVIKLGDRERSIITKLASLIKDDSLSFGEWSTREALKGKLNVFNLKNKSSHNDSEDEETESLKVKQISSKKQARIGKKKLFKGKNKKEEYIEDVEQDEDEEEDLLS